MVKFAQKLLVSGHIKLIFRPPPLPPFENGKPRCLLVVFEEKIGLGIQKIQNI